MNKQLFQIEHTVEMSKYTRSKWIELANLTTELNNKAKALGIIKNKKDVEQFLREALGRNKAKLSQFKVTPFPVEGLGGVPNDR